MRHNVIFVLAQITRIDTSALVLATVFLPIYISTEDIHLSIIISIPSIFISMMIFVSNDYADRDADLVNHPSRPLPIGSISPRVAIIVYFTALCLSLTTMFYIDDTDIVIAYAALALSAVSYNYVKEQLPQLKAVYVSACSVLPIIIVGAAIGGWLEKIALSVALFMFCLSRELLMDVADLAGDSETIPKTIGRTLTIRISYILQFIAILVMAVISRSVYDLIAFTSMTLIAALSLRLWGSPCRRDMAISLMRAPMLIGIYYLV